MVRLWAVVAAVVLMLIGPAVADRRVALVLGNAAYEDTARLANPVNDATDVAAKLRQLGFEVHEGYDLGKRDLERRIGAFSDALPGASTGLLYYAGHGIQVDGRNFIIPVDARLDQPTKLRLEAVGLDDIVDIIEAEAGQSIIFLDACRNNPFARTIASSRGATALAGLAQFASTRGSFIAFATAPGQVALDGSGRNSPFTSALLRHIDRPGQSISDLMIAVRRDVVEETREQQRPWEQGSLTERFEFVPAGGGSAVVAAPVQPPSGTQTAALQRSIADTSSIEAFVRDTYLAVRPGEVGSAVPLIYDSTAAIYGAIYDIRTIAALKELWFARWSSWSLTLEPGSLAVETLADGRVRVTFDMGYDYEPRAGQAQAGTTGRARVVLELIARDGWRVVAETSEALAP